MSLSCSNHPGADAELECGPCRKVLCAACVRRVRAHGGFVNQCAACLALLRPLVVQGHGQPLPQPALMERHVAVVADPRPLVQRLPGAIAYVARPSVLMGLGGLALLCTPLYYLAARAMVSMAFWALLVMFIAFGLESAIYFRIVETGAHGEPDLDPPDITSLWDDLLAPATRYIAATLPILFAIAWFGDQISGSYLVGFLVFVIKPTAIYDTTGPAALFTAGLLLWPLLTAIAAIGRSASAALNPGIWVKTFKIMKADYLIGMVAFYGVIAFDVFVWLRVRLFVAEKVQISYLTPLILAFLGYLPMALRGRVLGQMCQPYMER